MSLGASNYPYSDFSDYSYMPSFYSYRKHPYDNYMIHNNSQKRSHYQSSRNAELSLMLASLNQAYKDMTAVEKFKKDEVEPTMIVKPFLYLGGIKSINSQTLEKLGITHILNVAKEVELNVVKLKNKNIKILEIPAIDTNSYNIREDFERAFKFIESARMSQGKIIVHCARGISRSATIIMAYLMFRHGMSMMNSYSYVKLLRPVVNPNQSFTDQLKYYEYECKKKRRTQKETSL